MKSAFAVVVAILLTLVSTTAYAESATAQTASNPDIVAQRLDQAFQETPRGGSVAALVLDAESGKVLYNRESDTLSTPASSIKILTAAAALSQLGAESRIITSVEHTGQPDQLTLVGRGDVLLTEGESDSDAVIGHAGLTSLAGRTAIELKRQGISEITLSYDGSIFSGDALHPGHYAEAVDDGNMAPMSAVALNSAFQKGNSGPRSHTPQQDAVTAFTAALQAQGVAVKGEVKNVSTPEDSKASQRSALASVSSAPMREIVQHMLQESDNYSAEVLGRLVAVHQGKAGTPQDAAQAISQSVKELGIDIEGSQIVDSCGLSEDDRISPRMLADALKLSALGSSIHQRDSASDDSPAVTTTVQDLSWIRSGLPVAGLTGTLADRFDEPGDIAGRGVVQAKTGTLLEVTSLSGFAQTASGETVIYAFMLNKVPDVTAARKVVDRAAAVLSECGCS